ncbi:hypothetical protein ACSSS7_001079 [Eimeria intestinalis]
MDYLKQFFKSAFSQYVEVVHDDMISFGYEKGLEIRDLRLKTQVINEALEASQSEARLECGRIGRMNLVYTPLPGIVTLVHPCRIPRAPPIVRRARYIRALPSPSPHFQRPEAMQQRAQRAATSNERVQLAQNSTIPQQSVTTLHGAFTEAPTPAAAAAAATAAAAAAAASAAGAKAAAAAAAAEPIKGYHHPLPNPSGLCMQNAPPPFVGPPPPLSFGFLPQTFHQQTAMTGCPQTTIAGNGAPLNAGFWGPPSAAAMTPAAAPLSSRQGLISPSSVARGYLQAPTAFTSSQQMHAKSLGLDLMAAAVDPPAFSIKGMPPDQHITAAFKAHSNL